MCRREIDALKDWVRNLNSRVEVEEMRARGDQRESAAAPPQYGGSEQGPPIPAAWPYANESDAPSPWPYEHGVSSPWPNANAPVAPASWPYESGASTPLSPTPERPPAPGRPRRDSVCPSTAATMTAIGLITPLLFNLFGPRDRDKDDNILPSMRTMERWPFVRYLLTAVFLQCLIFFSIESFSFFNWTFLLINIAGSTVLTTLFCIALELIRKRP